MRRRKIQGLTSENHDFCEENMSGEMRLITSLPKSVIGHIASVEQLSVSMQRYERANTRKA
jgi:hypothetical protein